MAKEMRRASAVNMDRGMSREGAFVNAGLDISV